MIEYGDLRWEMDRLFHGKKDTSIRLVRDEKLEFMYWLEWDFGKPEKSVNFYNIINAKENGKILYMRTKNRTTEDGPEKLTGAFK